MGWGPVSRVFDKVVDVAQDGSKGFSKAVDHVKKNVSPSDVGHVALDVVGLVPVAGEAADLANAGWYAAEGNYADAALSAAGAIPFAGWGATAAKGVKYGMKAADAGKAATKAGDQALEAGETASKVADDAADGATPPRPQAGDAGGPVDPPGDGKKTAGGADEPDPDPANGPGKAEGAKPKHLESASEVEIVDARGNPVGEFDEVRVNEGKLFEDKSASGIDKVHPRTGQPVQTPQQWAERQIFDKTDKRIENLDKAAGTRNAKDRSEPVPTLDEIKGIHKLEFRIDNADPNLQQAVNAQLQRLEQKYPGWEFSASYGG